MKLCDSVVKSFCIAKNFQENSERINSIDFSANGENLISSSDDDSIVIYECANEGKPKRTLYSKKYGVDNIKYTHAGNTVIYSSNKVDDAIRYQQGGVSPKVPVSMVVWWSFFTKKIAIVP